MHRIYLTRIRRTITLVLVLCGVFGSASAQDAPTDVKPVAERPWAAAWMSSLARILAGVDVIYDSIDRQELSISLEERLNFSEFRGIDRTRPLGMMWTWDDVNDPPAIIFVPVHQIDNLMKTATFGVVDFHKVKENQYEIERPGAPYHVIVRSGFAMFGEEVPALEALRDAPDRLTKNLKDKYDLVLMLDQRQVPRTAKQKWVDDLRQSFEPWLQQQDDEPAESATVRRALGKALLDGMEALLRDVHTITLGGRIDGRTRNVQVDLILEAEPGSSVATELNRLVVRQSQFSALVNKEASAGLAINWPLMLLGKELPAIGGKNLQGRLDMGIQLIGSDWSDITLIAGIRGAEAVALNATMPTLLSRMEKSGDFTAVERSMEHYRNVDVHRLVPGRLPDLLRAITPSDAQILVGQGKDTVWMAAGVPESLLERLKAAVDVVEDTPPGQRSGSVMSARLSVGQWPTVLPVVDPQNARAELLDSKDGFSLTVQPVRNGLKIQLVAEEGLLRVIGRHWATQVDLNPSQ